MGKKSEFDVEKGPHRPSSSPSPRHHKHRYPSPIRMPPPTSHDQWFPWLMPMIFLVNIAAFIYTMYVNNCPSREGNSCVFSSLLGRFSFEPFKTNPMLGPSSTTLQQLGGLERKLVVDDKESWRLVSCIWLHAGALHLATNMLSLLVVAISLEQEFGFLKIGVLYVLSGIGGSLMSTLSTSGHASISCRALTILVIVVVFNMAIGMALPRVDYSAHFGGLIAGFLLGFVLLVRPQYGYVSRRYIPAGYDLKRKKSKYKLYQYFLWIVALLLLLAGFAIGFAEVFNGQKII
ncbi:hypothetical protein SAY87_012287 [Trapa incisa]|uniref:RHOMBOID-like protein n=1 Tax=Trapa incisa TaxID=236973 RepID=A0AAN7JJL9_9MYRT|nr:hypothetical protein SAY87_012287 [Trapa incisa]